MVSFNFVMVGLFLGFGWYFKVGCKKKICVVNLCVKILSEGGSEVGEFLEIVFILIMFVLEFIMFYFIFEVFEEDMVINSNKVWFGGVYLCRLLFCNDCEFVKVLEVVVFLIEISVFNII